MKKQFFQICSFFLCVAMLIGMLPTQVIAETTQTESLSTNTATENAQAAEAETYADAIVLGEIVEDRTEYSKDFLLSNGTHVAAVYADPIHYEKDGSWQEIDNTLKLSKEGTYVNAAGALAVALPQSISKTAPVTVSRDGHELSFFMSGELRTQGNLEVAAIGQAAETATVTLDGKVQTFQVSGAQTVSGQVQAIDNSEAKAAAKHPEMVLDKSASVLMYSGVYANTQLRYDLHGSTLKESVILQSYSSNLRGYRYTLNTGDLLPLLNEDGSIYFLSGKKDVVFVMKAPYLIDDAEQCSNDVRVSLTGSDGTYTLTYLLPTAWLASADRAWPVVLDPAITTSPSVMNIRDHTVASNGSYHYERPVLECGYGNSNHVQRIFLKYRELPTLTSSDVIIDAQVALYKIENSSSAITVDVHKVDSTWESETLTWANKPGFDETIEDYALIDLKGYYIWNVTDIVRGWYSGANTGMMFKASDQYEDGTAATWKQFASSDNGYSGWMPSLQITFRNNNGIESYWDYTASSAGRAGTGYVNSYTGNLVWIRGDMGFGGNRMPVSISHVYNLNDSADNEFGMGYGWRTNYNQLVYTWTYNSVTYYVWEDSDGTSHYFNRQSNGTYKDEDGLELTLSVSGSTKTITDKNGNKSYFDSNGRLYKLENNQATKSSINISYISGKQIDYITDGVNRKYDFSYTDGLLTKIEYLGTGSTALFTNSFAYDSNGNLISVTDFGKTDDNTETDTETETVKTPCAYTYSNHVLETATDIDGYAIEYACSILTDDYQPYRVLSVEESDGDAAGGILTIEYEHNQTTFTSYLDADKEESIKQILQFNNCGNVTAIMDDEGHAQYAKYATDSGAASAKGNQLIRSSKLQNTVANRISDPSFENGSTLYALTDTQVSNTTEAAYLGTHAQKIVVTTAGSGVKTGALAVPAGKTVTYSIYVKAPMAVTISAQGGSSTVIGEKSSGDSWQRLQVSYTNDTATTQNIYAQLTVETPGTFYLDCLQREFAATASRFNMLGNADFHTTDYLWLKTNCESTDVLTTTDPAAPQLNNTVFKIAGNPLTTKRIYQTVPVSGVADDTFVVSGWAKGNSASVYEEPPTGQNKREYAVYATFRYTDGTTSDPFIARFNPNTDQWQYAAQVMVAKKDYTSIKVSMVYDYNVNTVYFDGLGLFKEEFASSYTYDEDGNITSIVDLQKQKTTYEYDTNSNLVKEILPTDAELTYTYDDYHNVKTAKTAENVEYAFEYDAWGNNTSVSIKNGDNRITTSATFSTDGNRLLKTTDALGKHTHYDYDPDTNLLKSVKYPNDTDDTKTAYTYDEDTLRIKEITAKSTCGNSTSGVLMELKAEYAYNDKDLLSQIKTPKTEYNFTYGNFSLRTEVKVGSQLLASYAYEPVTNRLKTLAYGNGNMVQYTYDSKGRILSQRYDQNNEDTVTYTYDNNGALATVTDANGIKTTYYYDFLDRVVKYVESGTGYSHTVGYEYDNINNLTTQVETINGVDRSTTYEYDKDNRVTSKQTGNTKVTYKYDPFGRIENQKTYNGENLILTETFAYNGNSSQIAEYTTAIGEAEDPVTKTYYYEYDGNGNILSIRDSENRTTRYVYDSANQLVRENNEEKGYTHTWTYDSAGNIQNRKEYAYTTDELGEELGSVSYTYGDSNWGDLLKGYNNRTIHSDAIGNPLDDGTWTYEWQHGRQLASMEKKDGTAEWEFAYNADGLRTQRTDGTTTYNYVYNGSQLTAMTVGTNTLYFSYDAAGTPMSVKYGNEEYFYTSNIQGDVTGIVKADGTTVVAYTYDAWGNILSTTGTAATTLGALNPLRYRGYVYDQETGLYYLQSRYYNPEIGRFINADAFASTGQGLLGNNMFAYCLNNPITGCDPCGSCFHRWDFWNNCEKCGGGNWGQTIIEVWDRSVRINQELQRHNMQITQEQNKIVLDAANSLWDAYTRGYNIYQENHRHNQMVLNEGIKFIIDHPEESADLAIATYSVVSSGYGVAMAIASGNPVTGLVVAVVAVVVAGYGLYRAIKGIDDATS